MNNKISRFNYIMIEELRGKAKVASCVEILVKLYLLGYVKQLNAIECFRDLQNLQIIKEHLEFLFKEIGEKYHILQLAIEELNEEKGLDDLEINTLVKLILDVPFSKEDWKNAIEDLISLYDDGMNGYIQTPQCINRLGIELLSLEDGSFYDGSAGMNGTAIAAYKYAKEKGLNLTICTQERLPKIAAIGVIRAFINGITDIKSEIGDILSEPKFIEGDSLKRFDYVMMDFPFGMPWSYKENELIYDKYSRFIYGNPNKSNSEWLFISHMIKSLKDKGKAAALVSSGSLFNTGTESIRENVIKDHIIEAIIALPSGLFSRTSIPVNMILMNKSKQSKNKILFIKAEDIVVSISRSKKEIDRKGIERIVDIYRSNLEIEGVSKLVEIEQLEKSMLLPNKYVYKLETETENFGKVKIKLDQINSLTNIVRLGDIGKIFRGINTSSCIENPESGKYKIINLVDVKDGELNLDNLTSYDINSNSKIDGYTVKAGDIIVSSKGSIIKICIIPEHEGKLLISQNYIGIRLNKKQSSKFVKEYLESPLGNYLLSSKQLGSTIKMLNPKDLQDVYIVSLPATEQEKVIKEYEEKEKRIKAAITKLEREAKEVQLNLYKQMGIYNTFKLEEGN